MMDWDKFTRRTFEEAASGSRALEQQLLLLETNALAGADTDPAESATMLFEHASKVMLEAYRPDPAALSIAAAAWRAEMVGLWARLAARLPRSEGAEK